MRNSRTTLWILVFSRQQGDQFFGIFSGKRQAFTILDDIGKGACGILGPVFFLVEERFQFRKDFRKHFDARVELVQNATNHRFEFRVKGVVAILVLAPTDCGVGDGVEEFSRRVKLPCEEFLVQYGHLEHRDLKAPDEGLHRSWNFLVVQNEIEHHRDDVEHHGVHFRHAVHDIRLLQIPEHVDGAGVNTGNIQGGELFADCLCVSVLQMSELADHLKLLFTRRMRGGSIGEVHIHDLAQGVQ